MDFLELAWHWPASNKPDNYPDEQAAETLHEDEGPEHQQFSYENENEQI